jgi:CRISPR system Cascade subunit CasC
VFLQVHFLTNYHASLLNRDDAGLAKRISFGGYPRLRVSSQCQKRHWREWMITRTDAASAIRSRHFFSRVVKQQLVDQGMPADQAHALTLALATSVLKTSGDKSALDKGTLEMKQPVLFGHPEARYFVRLIQDAVADSPNTANAALENHFKEHKSNFQALVRACGITDPAAGFEGAMFGRFVTSDILVRVDAPVHVAHAFTTHALDTEVDFFTVVDDLAEDDETGAAHANDTEIGAGLFYGYVAVDVPLLISNLTGCEAKDWRQADQRAARELLALLVHAIAEVSPGAKLGSTAPYARAECVLLETGATQPRSLGNAFLRPVRLGHRDEHPTAASVRAMATYLDDMDQMYGETIEGRSLSSLHPWARDQTPLLQSAPLQRTIETAMKSLFGDPA